MKFLDQLAVGPTVVTREAVLEAGAGVLEAENRVSGPDFTIERALGDLTVRDLQALTKRLDVLKQELEDEQKRDRDRLTRVRRAVSKVVEL